MNSKEVVITYSETGRHRHPDLERSLASKDSRPLCVTSVPVCVKEVTSRSRDVFDQDRYSLNPTSVERSSQTRSVP